MTSKSCSAAVDMVECNSSKRSAKFSVFNYMESLVRQLNIAGRYRTAETYASTLNSFRRFRRGVDIPLRKLTSEILLRYQVWLRTHGLVDNTTSFYMRILRATYNRASEEEGFPNAFPFRKVYTGVDKTIKRALPVKALKKLMRLDLSEYPPQELARDIFILSFMLRGISFIDLAYLKKSDLHNGHIIYRRRKTGQMLTVCWTPEMQRLMDRHPNPDSEYLLPLLGKGDDHRTLCKNAFYNLNRNLKIVGLKAGVSTSLTLYVARHSWASIAKAQGVPLSVISDGLGHDSELTTRIYLASLDSAVIDRANSRIIRSLLTS